MRLELKKHNKVAYERVMAAFEEDRMTCVCHPTGTGKSYIVAAVTEHFKRVIILAPNIFVLRQQRQVINWRKDIEYRTYQWLNKNVTNITEQYDLIVIDEFHRAGAPEWSAAVGLLIESQTEAKVLGTSATPIRYLDDERNMADELFNGHVASNMTIAEAWTVYNVLPIPRYVSGLFRWDKTIDDAVERINKSRTLNDEEKRQRIFRLSNKKLSWECCYGMPAILRKHLDKDARRVIVFCSHIEMLEQMKDEVCGWFRSAGFALAGTYILHSQLKDSEQRNQMQGFEADTNDGVKLMFCVDMLNEGIHVPNISAVLMLRTTSSRIIYMQQMGRCLTTANTENPLVLDMVDNITTTTDIRGFQDEFKLMEKLQAEREKREPRNFEVIDYTMSVRQVIDKLVPDFKRKTDDIMKGIEDFFETHGRRPSRYVADEHHIEQDWHMMSQRYPDSPIIVKCKAIDDAYRERQTAGLIAEVERQCEEGKPISAVREWRLLCSRCKGHPAIDILRKKYGTKGAKPRVPIDETLDKVEDVCKKTGYQPRRVDNESLYLSWLNIKKEYPDNERVLQITDNYDVFDFNGTRTESSKSTIRTFITKNGRFPRISEPEYNVYSQLRKRHRNDPEIQEWIKTYDRK